MASAPADTAPAHDWYQMCPAADLKPGQVYSRMLCNDETGMPLVALVVRDHDDDLHAYRNLCRHLAVPLDGGTGDLLSKKRTHLLCGTHGALYRLNDGLCTAGPCEGMHLFRLRYELRDGMLFVDAARVFGG